MAGPYPWSFDETTDNWYRGLYPGLWFLFLLYPLVVAGIWRMRARPELAVLLVPILVHVILATLSTELALRVRSSVEPLLIILAVAGMSTWRRSAQLASVGLAAAGLAAGVHQGSVLWSGGVLAVAVGLAFAARWLPDDRLAEEPAPTPLESAFGSRQDREDDENGSDAGGEPEPMAAVSAGESPPPGQPGGG